MKNLNLLIIVFQLLIVSVNAQLADWTAYNPAKFPKNVSGQINGVARTSQLKFHPTNPNKYYAVVPNGGLFTSENGGENWTAVPGTEDLPLKLASVCIDYTDDNILYLGTGDPNFTREMGAGIFKSIDGGLTFDQLTGGMPTANVIVFDIIMDPADHNTLVAATNTGIYKTKDGGLTWALKTANNIFFCDMQKGADPASKTLFASTMTTIPEFYRSVNFGETWTNIKNGISAPTVEPVREGSRIAVTPADTNVVYLGLVSSGGMLYKSIDGGLSFTLMKGPGTPYITYYSNDATSSSQGNYNYCITADRLNAQNVWVHSHCSWFSGNSGQNWTKQTVWSQKLHTDMHHVIQSPYDPNKLFSCNDGGIFLSTDGGANWKPKSDGIFAFDIGNYAGKGSPTRRDFINIGTQDNGELYADSSGWVTIRGGDWYAYNEIDFRNNSTMLYYSANPRRRMHDVFLESPYGLPAGTRNWDALEFNRMDKNLAFIALTDTVLRSDNILSSAPVPTWIQFPKINSQIRAMHSCISDPNRLYVLAADRKIYVSKNALSATPTFSSYVIPSTLMNTATITAICNNANKVYISIDNKVFYSDNGGSSWTNISYNLPSVNHRRILSEEYGGTEELVFIATNTGVFYKKASQTSWTNFSTNLPTRKPATELSLYDDGTDKALLRFTSFGRGVWQTPISKLRLFSSTAPEVKKTEFNLITYPNPTSEIVNVRFYSEKPYLMTMELIDISGIQIKTHQFTSKTGENYMTLNVNDCPMGFYTLKLSHNNFIQTKKIVITP